MLRILYKVIEQVGLTGGNTLTHCARALMIIMHAYGASNVCALKRSRTYETFLCDLW